MRAELIYNPSLLLERLGQWAIQRSRRRELRRTVAGKLQLGHIDSLELLKLIRPLSPNVIYDIGANVGTWTLLCKAVFPEVQIHAFEPLALHVDGFKKSTRGLTGVRLHEVALGPENRMIEMRVTNSTDASSLLPLTLRGRERFGLEESGRELVKVKRLDEFVSLQGLCKPDLLKMDVQGFELQVLNGAKECLEVATAVLVEVSFQEFYSGQCLFHEIIAGLAQCDFRLCAFGHGTAVARILAQTDALFVKEQVLHQLL